jgi:hypothetical protein
MVVSDLSSKADATKFLLHAVDAGGCKEPPVVDLQRWNKDDARTRVGANTEKVRKMRTAFSFTALMGFGSEALKKVAFLALKDTFSRSSEAFAVVSSCDASKDPLVVYPRTVNQCVQELLDDASPSFTQIPEAEQIIEINLVYWADGAGDSTVIAMRLTNSGGSLVRFVRE